MEQKRALILWIWWLQYICETYSVSHWMIAFCFHIKCPHVINSAEAQIWGFVFEAVPSAYSQKNVPHLLSLSLGVLLTHSLWSWFSCWPKTKKTEKLITALVAFQLDLFFRGRVCKNIPEINATWACVCVSVCLGYSFLRACVQVWISNALVLSQRLIRPHKTEVVMAVGHAQIWISCLSFCRLFSTIAIQNRTVLSASNLFPHPDTNNGLMHAKWLS